MFTCWNGYTPLMLCGDHGSIRLFEAIYRPADAAIRPDWMDDPTKSGNTLVVAILVAQVRATAGLVGRGRTSII